MLETTVFRVFPYGNQEPKKLQPYVKVYDAFAIDWPGFSDANAARMEQAWQTLLNRDDVSRSEFLRVYDNTLDNRAEPYTLRQYKRAVFDYLFRERVPMCYAERWQDPKDGEDIAEAYKKSISRIREGFDFFNKGIENGLVICYGGWKMRAETDEKRDMNVAANIPRMETILEAYHPLRDKKLKKLAILASHSRRIDKFAKVYTRSLVDETEKLVNLVRQLDDLALRKVPFEEAELFLRWIAPQSYHIL